MINKRNFLIITVIASLIFLDFQFSFALYGQKRKPQSQLTSLKSCPDSIECVVQPFYRHRPDGKPGREITLKFTDPKFSGKVEIETKCSGGWRPEKFPLDVTECNKQFPVLLPPGVGVESDAEVTITLRRNGQELVKPFTITIPKKRQWTVYIYPHSHVDIGYTNTQKNVKMIHQCNLICAIDLAKKTKNYPKDARYLWNPEVLWSVERYLRGVINPCKAEKKAKIIEAVQKGYLRLDAGYVNCNTSSASDEELFEFFHQSKEMEKRTGTKIETLVQVDVPGMSWGIVPVASKLGIKYCFALNNGSDRVGHSTELSFKPFWWLGPDGTSRILFLQPGSYTPGADAKGEGCWKPMVGVTEDQKLWRLIQPVKTDDPRKLFIDNYLNNKLPELEKSDYYPYDIFAMSWAMADNTPIDADLPDAVKSWNEDYAFPHLIIAGASDIMRVFEEKYGNQLPVRKGDFTEYWTDGLGTTAKQTGMNRSSKERLIQAETLWSMLHPGEPAPCSDFEEAWRNVIMGTEHTYCYTDPEQQPITNEILKVKFEYFQKAEKQSKELLNSALSAVADTGSSEIGVFNTLSWQRSGLVYIPSDQSCTFNSICTENGDTVISQRLSTGELVFLAKDVPALGARKYRLQAKKNKIEGTFALNNNILDNGIVKVIIDFETGDIVSLTHGGHEFVNSEAKCFLNSFRYLHDGDSSDKAIGTTKVNISIKENGPLLAAIHVKSDAEGCNSLTRDITVIAGQAYVEIRNIIDKQAITKKEGIHFGFAFNVPDPVTRVDIPWGIMELEEDQLPEANRNWIAFQRWLDISNDNLGITFCSLDAPVFESGEITANIIGSATNSRQWIRKLEPSATIYSWALNNHWHTNFPLSQEGVIQFRYRILAHNTKYDPVLSNRFGLEQAQPLIACPVKTDFKTGSRLAIKGSDRVFITILKTGIDGNTIKIRLRSVSDKDETVKLDWTGTKPDSVNINDYGKGNMRLEVKDEVLVPAMGLITLEVKW